MAEREQALVWSAARALQNKQRPFTVKQGKHGLVFKPSKPVVYILKGEFCVTRVMPPEYYLLTEPQRKKLLTRLTAWQLRYCMDYLLHFVPWTGRVPETEYWRLECGMRLILLLRDSEEPQKQERFRQLVQVYRDAGGYGWEAPAWDKYRLKAQRGWSTQGARVFPLEQSRAGGGVYWPETWDVPACPECDSVRSVDALSGHYQCWCKRCSRSRWNTGTAKSRTWQNNKSYKQCLNESVSTGLSAFPASTPKPSEYEVEKVGKELRDLLEQAGAVQALRNKRVR